MMGLVRLSVVVPCYNEEASVRALLEDFSRVFAAHRDVEVICVDNGSTDSTGRILDEEIAGRGYAQIRKVSVPVNQGYGHGILTGLAAAKGEILAWTHADRQTDPADVLEAYRVYQAHSAVGDKWLVKGRRVRRPWGDKLFSLGMQLVSSAALGVWMTEVNAQPKVFPRGLYEEMTGAPEDFSLDLYLLYLAVKNGYRILTVPVEYRPRLAGEAKGGGGSFRNRWKLMRRTAAYIFKLRSELMKTHGG